MWFQGLLPLLFGVLSVICSKQLKGNVQLDCHAENASTTRFILTGIEPDDGFLIRYGSCPGSGNYCRHHRDEIKWRKAACYGMQGGERLYYMHHSEVTFAWLYAIKVYRNNSKEGNQTLIHNAFMNRSSYLQDCFDDFRTDIDLSTGKFPSLGIHLSLNRVKGAYVEGDTWEITVFSYTSGENLKPKCPRDDTKTDLESDCETLNLAPCQKYNICVKTLINLKDIVDKGKLVNCKNYTMTPNKEISPVRNLLVIPIRASGYSRFSWQDPEPRNKDQWFFKTTVQFYGKQNTTLSNITNQTALEFVPPTGTERCSLSVTKCLPCYCSKTVERQSTECAVRFLSPGKPYKQFNKEVPAYILMSFIVILLVIGLSFVTVLGFRKILHGREHPVNAENLQTIEEVWPCQESFSSSEGCENIPLSIDTEAAYNIVNSS